jgi:predicted transcriptional regulator
MRIDEIVSGIRAVLAMRLVRDHGFSRKRAAEVLGTSQPTITLYLSERRASSSARRIMENEAARRYLDELIERILSRGVLKEGELYDAAFNIRRSLEVNEGVEVVPSEVSGEVVGILEFLRRRVQAEQESAEEFMRAAINLRDDLARMIFRALASDCLRHADILMTLISAIEKGGAVDISQLRKVDVKSLLRKEEEAHIGGLGEVEKLLPEGFSTLLVEFIKSDEEKHSKVLRRIMGMIREV